MAYCFIWACQWVGSISSVSTSSDAFVFVHPAMRFIITATRGGQNSAVFFNVYNTDIVPFLCFGQWATIILLLYNVVVATNKTPHTFHISCPLSLATAGVWSVRGGCASANAEKSVCVGVLGSVWKPCWPWLHPFTSSNALWQTSHRHATVWLHRRKSVCARAALSLMLSGGLYTAHTHTHTHTYTHSLWLLCRARNRKSVAMAAVTDSTYWECEVNDETVWMQSLWCLTRTLRDKRWVSLSLPACVSLVFLFLFFPTYFPHLLSWHTIVVSVECFAISTPKINTVFSKLKI